MGKKLDAFLGRCFKTSKFKAMVNLAVSRLAVLKNQRQARCSIARSDVVEFLNTSNHDRALLRVEQVIKEQNMLDVFVLLEGYCHLLVERINLIEQHKFCPEELNEAVSTLIYAATRCGEFPELQEIRAIFTSRYGKEFASRAIELHNNCGVNPKIIQKLSTRMPSLENKMKVLKDIASDNNIDLPMEETISDTKMDSGQEKKQSSSPSGPLSPSGVSNEVENMPMHHEEIERSMRGRKYKDVADAAQAAFESAAYAAAAARAAVELSRSESTDPDDPNSPNRWPRKLTATIEPISSRLQTRGEDSSEDEEIKSEIEFEKTCPVPDYGSEMKRSFSASSSDSDGDNVDGIGVGEEGQFKMRGLVFDESEDEEEQKLKMKPSANYPAEFDADKGSERIIEPLNINRKPISVRTRWTHGR